MLEFDEVVYAKPLKKLSRKRSLRSQAILGVWPRIQRRTCENRVALMNGGPVIRVRTLIRAPDSAKSNAEEIMKLVATPRQPSPRDKDQEEANNIRDPKGVDLGGDGPQLAEIPCASARKD